MTMSIRTALLCALATLALSAAALVAVTGLEPAMLREAAGVETSSEGIGPALKIMAVLGKLGDFRGASRFTTWAYKFALLEAGVKLRRRAWQGREVVLEPEGWSSFAEGGTSAQGRFEQTELFDALREAIEGSLTPHQRQVFSALALNDVPIDVLAERLNTTRGALYKALHDARRKLRRELEAGGHLEAGPQSLEKTT